MYPVNFDYFCLDVALHQSDLVIFYCLNSVPWTCNDGNCFHRCTLELLMIYSCRRTGTSWECIFEDKLLENSTHYIGCYFHYQYVIDHLGYVVLFEMPSSECNSSTTK